MSESMQQNQWQNNSRYLCNVYLVHLSVFSTARTFYKIEQKIANKAYFYRRYLSSIMCEISRQNVVTLVCFQRSLQDFALQRDNISLANAICKTHFLVTQTHTHTHTHVTGGVLKDRRFFCDLSVNNIHSAMLLLLRPA